MALDGIFLSKLKDELKSKIVGARIDIIDGINKTDYLFRLRQIGISYNLFLSVSYHNPTIFLMNSRIEKPPVASNFTMFLRKYLEGGYIKDVLQINNDRIIEIDVLKKNDFDGEKEIKVVLELIGRFSNLLIVDENNKIKEAIKELSAIESSRGIMRGLTYIPPKNDKVSYLEKEKIVEHFNLPELVNQKEICSYISGVSPLLADKLENEYKESNKDFYSILIENINKYSPTLKGDDYYFFDIFEGDSYSDLSSLLEAHYELSAKEKTLRDNNQEVFRVIKSNKKRLEKKLVKLDEDLKRSENADELRLKGELLLANSHLESRGSLIKLLNYYDGKEIEISINPSKSLKDNSQDYYKKYRKSKNAKEFILHEIDYSTKELEYFNELEVQLEKASLKDVLEIKNELEDNHYLKNKDINKKKKKNQKPNFLTFKVNDCNVYVGKNNIQNDYLTHTLARKEDYFFHVKDGHGSHVIVSGENKDSEEVIRFAALKASEYSSMSDSTSVPVNYTLVKNLKKIPGFKGSKVTLTKYKTIYVDPKRDI